jgi:hypothetical protein
MRRMIAPSLLFSLVLLPHALAQAPRPGTQVRLALATYVALGYDNGQGFVSELSNPVDVLPEERLALDAIRDEIERWGKYVITPRPAQAELLIAVRKGRLVTVGTGMGAGGRSGLEQPGGVVKESWAVGGALSTPEDMIEVWDADGLQLWRGIEKGGLNGNPPPLFRQFRRDVELVDKTYRKDEAKPEEETPKEER